jgi:hypothetical protein
MVEIASKSTELVCKGWKEAERAMEETPRMSERQQRYTYLTPSSLEAVS